MDPLSTPASILTFLEVAGSTCKILYNLTLDLKDAPDEIRSQSKKLQCLNGTITNLLHVCNKISADFQLDSQLEGLDEFIQDLAVISDDIKSRKDSLFQSKVSRVKESIRWLPFNRRLKKFFDNLEHYDKILSHAMWRAEIALLEQIASQTAAPKQLDIGVPYTSVANPHIYPTANLVRGVDDDSISKTTHPVMTAGMKRLYTRLSKTMEAAGILVNYRQRIALGSLQLDCRSGSAITRQWSQNGQGIYTSKGHAVSLIFEPRRFIYRRLELCFFILHDASYSSRLSLHCNLDFPTLVAVDDRSIKAVKMGDIDYLRDQISSGRLAISTTTSGGYTLLHWAAYHDQADILTMLVQNGADVNVTNDRGETILHVSVKQNRNHESVRRLLELGADPCQPDIEGRTALHVFYNDITAYILQDHSDRNDIWAQDNTGRTILHYQAWSSRSSAQDLSRCIAADSSSQAKRNSGSLSPLCIKDAEGKSVLHYATQRGNLGLVDFLLGRPDATSLGMPDYSGCTLLHYATESSRTQTIDLLLSRGFDSTAVDDGGRTVLHHACQWGNLKAVKHLLGLGFDYQLDVLDRNDRTPLKLASEYRSQEVLEYLQALRPDLTEKTRKPESGTMHVCHFPGKFSSNTIWVLFAFALIFGFSAFCCFDSRIVFSNS